MSRPRQTVRTLTYFATIATVLALASPAWGQELSHLWSQGFGGPELEQGTGIALDGSGNVVVTGTFSETASFGGDPLVSAGELDIFVAKYAPDGTHVWSQGFGGTSWDDSIGFAVDGAGNVVVTGTFLETANFGGDPLESAGGNDVFVAKYAPDGTHLWSQGFGGTASEIGEGIAVDGSGNVVVTGLFGSTANFGGDPLTPVGLVDVFVAKYAPDGTHLWSQGFGGTQSEGSRSLALDGAGNIVVTGLFEGTANFGGDPITSAGLDDIFVAKYAADGTHIWSQGFGGTDRDQGRDVAVDGSGNVVVMGSFSETVSFGGDPITTAGFRDIFVAKYAPDGTHLWSQGFSGTGPFDGSGGVAVDGAGNVVVTGWFAGMTNFGGDPLQAAGFVDVFIAKFAPNGADLWSQRFGGTGWDYGNAIAAGVSGNVAVTGWFEGTANFGGDPLTSVGSNDIFIAMYTPPCVGDVNGDGTVDVLDLLAVLEAWGPCPGCPEDITGDGIVDVLDLLELLLVWGPCA